MDLARRTLDVMAFIALLILGAFIGVSSWGFVAGKVEFQQYAATIGPLAGAAMAFFKRDSA